MIPQFNFVVLDVIVVAVLIALLAIGVLKGAKHTFINISLLALSIGVGFISYTDFIKMPIVDFLAKTIDINKQISFTTEMKLGLTLLYVFMASLILTLAIYLLLRLIKLVIILIIRKRGKSRSKKSVASRVFGGLLNLIVYGVLLIVTLSMADNSLVGLDRTIENSYVTKYVSRADNMLFKALKKDGKEIENIITIIAIKGDLLAEEATDKNAKKLMDAFDAIGDSSLIPSELTLDNAQEVVNNFYYILSFEKEMLLDSKGKPLPGYEEFMAISNDAITRAVSSIASNYSGGFKLANIENTNSVYMSLESIIGIEVAEKFSSVFETN